MKMREFTYKLYNKLRAEFVLSVFTKKDYETYCSRYASYHHMKHGNPKCQESFESAYLTARPNPGAGIGHQMANWIAGYWFARYFNLKFAHTPFSDIENPLTANQWDSFLGFGNDEVQASDLIKKGWKKVILPLFNEFDENQVSIIRRIISSYSGEKVVFYLEQDQFYHDQYSVMDDIKRKFYKIHDRSSERLEYDRNEFNIAVHVRRGDIVQKSDENNPNLTMRWLDNDYFVQALRYTLSIIHTDKDVHIYLFSQGEKEDYAEFNAFPNVTYCLNMGAQESFLHMVYADVIITSKSSFSYKSVLLSDGLKVCPKNFWHGYPESSDWILLDDEGKRI